MKQEFFDWELTELNPWYGEVHRQRPDKWAKCDVDFHQAIHMNILLTGRNRMRIGISELDFNGISCILTSPWEPHGSFYEYNDSIHFMSVLHPDTLSRAMLGDASKLESLLALPPDIRHRIIHENGGVQICMKCIQTLFGNDFLELVKNSMTLHGYDWKLFYRTHLKTDYLHAWHAITGLFMDLLSALPDRILREKRNSHYSSLIPAFSLLASTSGRTTAREAADACNMSLSYFRKQFSAIVNTPFAEYELKYRFHNAVSELREKRLIIKEVAEKYDFYDISHFIRLFRKIYGTTPHKFLHSDGEGNDSGHRPARGETGSPA